MFVDFTCPKSTATSGIKTSLCLVACPVTSSKMAMVMQKALDIAGQEVGLL